jgi:hypothetical protein
MRIQKLIRKASVDYYGVQIYKQFIPVTLMLIVLATYRLFITCSYSFLLVKQMFSIASRSIASQLHSGGGGIF